MYIQYPLTSQTRYFYKFGARQHSLCLHHCSRLKSGLLDSPPLLLFSHRCQSNAFKTCPVRLKCTCPSRPLALLFRRDSDKPRGYSILTMKERIGFPPAFAKPDLRVPHPVMWGVGNLLNSPVPFPVLTPKSNFIKIKGMDVFLR